jgi:hypothetical protein
MEDERRDRLASMRLSVTTDLIPCQKYQSNSPPKPSF